MFGKYRLLRELGRGGMGIVYEALDTALGRRVALKTMIPGTPLTPDEALQDEARFLREGHLTANLPKHPHIVGIYEAGVVGGKRYLAMELVEGVSMSDWAAKSGPSLRQQVAVLRGASLAVHHAHAHGVVHRDLKPPNILVDGRNEPHVTDFGLAKMLGPKTNVSLTKSNVIVGTPAYISPEQAQGLRTVDHRTDVYALGVMLYEVLTGRPPFEGETAIEILMKAVKNPVPAPSTRIKQGVDLAALGALDTICLKALAKNPNERYPDAKALGADLTRWLKGEEVKVALPKTRRTLRRQRASWAAYAGVAAAIVLGIGILAFSLSESSKAKTEAQQAAEKLRRETAEKDRLEAQRREAEARLKAMQGRAMAASAVPNLRGLRAGVIGEYFGGTNFEMLSLRRVDREIGFPAAAGAAWPEGPADGFSIRWRGYLRVPETGPYVFQTRSEDGTRLFIDDVEILSNWMQRPLTTDSGICILEQGLHRVVVECFQAKGSSGLSVSCNRGSGLSGPGLEPSAFLHDPSAAVPLSRKPAWEIIDWEGIPGAQEGESLRVLECTGGATANLPFGRKKGLLLWTKDARPGHRLKLEFTAPAAARATLILALGRAKNLGIFKIALNGADLAAALDLYSPINISLETEFKNVDLKAGANALEFTIVGTNPSAVEWHKGEGVFKLTFDYLRFR